VNDDDDIELAEALKDVPTAKKALSGDVWDGEERTRLDRTNDAPPEEAPPPQPLLFTPQPAAKPAPNRAMIIAAGAAIAVVGIGLALSMGGSDAPPPPPAAATSAKAVGLNDGELHVVSQPDGADILIDGKSTGKKTPAMVEGLAVEAPLVVSIARRGFVAKPATLDVRIAAGSHDTRATFVLAPARLFTINTDPPGAEVTMDAKVLSGKTPLKLPPLEIGKRVTLYVSLHGHLPAQLELASAAATATVTALKLEAARSIEIATEPAGAKIYVDGKTVGLTPRAIAVPAARSFVLRLERPGFKPIEQKLAGGAAPERLALELDALPLSTLPLNADEKSRLGALESELAKLKTDLATAKVALKKSEAALAKAKDPARSFVSDTSELEAAAKSARLRLEELEAHGDETKGKMVSLRDEILDRLGVLGG